MTVAAAYLAGVLYGDGWITKLTIGLRCKDQDFAIAFADALNCVYPTTRMPARDERGYWLLRHGNKTGRFDGARDYGPATDEEKAAWLRGLFDSDGSAQCLKLPRGCASYHRQIRIFKTDIAVIERAEQFLADLAIETARGTIKNGKGHLGKKLVYEIRVLRRPSFHLFATIIGSSIERKAAALSLMVSTMQPDGWQARNWQKAIAARYPNRISL